MKKLFYLALAAITITLAACGDKGNGPEIPSGISVEKTFGADKFTIEFSEVTATTFRITITPADDDMPYAHYLLDPMDMYDNGNPLSVQDALAAKWSRENKTFYNFEEMVGVDFLTDWFGDKTPDSDYIIAVFQVDENNHVTVLAYNTVTTLAQ